MHGGTVADALFGDDGNDFIVGGEFTYAQANLGNVVPYQSELSGDDSLDGATGTDALYGFEGNDVLSGGDDNDSGTIVVPSGNGGTTTIAAGLFGGEGNDFLDGGRGQDRLDGGAGFDTVLGGEGDDTVLGGAGADTLRGGSGNDFLDGGADPDRMSGGQDNDIYVVDSASDLVFEAANEGFDTVQAGATFALGAAAHVEVLRTTNDAGTLSINLTGNALSQTLVGNAGRNVLNGLGGNDSLSGLGGYDQLLGGIGNDRMQGGAGADLFVGGRGLDRIHTGGADGVRDTVRYTSLLDSGVTASTRDQIRGFVHGQDKIDLRPIDPVPLQAGNQSFKVVTAFTSAPGEVRLVYSGANTLIQVDGDRDTAVDMVVTVVGVHVSAGDLIL
jgi:Ca2+-binding RTX toxin-like protein